MRVPLSPLFAAALLVAPAALSATQSRTALSSAQDLWQGRSEGVRVLPEGTLIPGTGFTKGADLAGTALCAARSGSDLFVGTGPSGDLLRVRGNAVSVLHHFSEPLVTAVVQGPGGKLWVGTSGMAKIYSVDPESGETALVVDLPGQYCWDLLPHEGEWLAAVGVPGGLWRVQQGRPPEAVSDPKAQHVRCMLAEGPRIWFGTAAPASLFCLEGGAVRRAASFDVEEVAALAASGGTLYAALNEKLDAPAAAPPKEGAATATGAAAASGKGQLFEMVAGGTPHRTASFASAILCLATLRGELLVGTRDGGLYAVGRGGASLLCRWEDSPVSALPASGETWWAITAAPGALWAPRAPAGGRYEAPVVDAGSPAKVSALDGFGEGRFALSVRCGDGPEPDSFWSAWSSAPTAAKLPPARFLQWRAELEGAGACVRGVRLAYRPMNRPPYLEAVRMAPPGEIQVKSSSQLGERLVQELHAKDRPYLSLAESKPSESGMQTYYLQGFRMVAFAATDPDGDDLRADLFLKPEGGSEWILLAEGVNDPFYVFESRALPDGRYQLKVVVRDDLGNPEGEALSAERIVPLFEVDNTPPRIEEAKGAPGRLRLDLSDASALRAARFSLDGKPWVPLAEASGAFGGSTVSVEVPLPASGRHWLAVEAVDGQGNRAVRGWIVP